MTHRPQWDFQPFKAPPKPKTKRWTVQFGERKFATVGPGKQIWWTKDHMAAVKQAALAGEGAKVITELEFHAAIQALTARQIHRMVSPSRARCGTAAREGLLITDHEGEVTCPGCALPQEGVCGSCGSPVSKGCMCPPVTSSG